MKKSIWKRGGALLLLGSMLIGVAGCAGNYEKGPESGQKNPGNALVVYAADYPKMNPYPENNGFEFDEAEYEAWAESQKEIAPSSEEYLSGVWEFSRDTMTAFLGDAKGENKIYSPVNIYMALGMLAEVTDGQSREQVLGLLHAKDILELRQNASDLWLAHYCDDGRFTSKLGASMWLDESVNYVPETLQQVAEVYRASSYRGEMGTPEMNTALQNWLNEQTGNLLKDQVAGVELDKEAILALATTLYYQAKWDREFNKNQTTEESFYAPDGDIKCDFMHDSGSGFYYWDDNFAAVQKSFEAGGGMFFILPDEDVTVESLLKDEQVLNLLENPDEWENKKHLIVNMSVPKFDAVSKLSLADELQQLGVTEVFQSGVADFSPLTKDVDGIYVSQVEHAARVKIDEEGCEAAAYTVIVMCGSAMPPSEEVDFVADRPFLFVITGRDGLPLFIGVVNQP